MDLGLVGEFVEEALGDGCVEGRGWGDGDVRGLGGGGVHKIEDTPERQGLGDGFGESGWVRAARLRATSGE